MAYEVLMPKVTAVSFSVNPVNAKAQTVISVKVVEVTVYLEPELRYSGEIYAGED